MIVHYNEHKNKNKQIYIDLLDIQTTDRCLQGSMKQLVIIQIFLYSHYMYIYIYIYTWKESNKRTRHLMYRHTVEKHYIFGSLSLMSCRIYVTNTYYTRLVRNILTPYYYPSMRWTTNALLVYWFSAWSVVKTCTHSYTHTEARFELYNMLHLLCVTNHSNSSCV